MCNLLQIKREKFVVRATSTGIKFNLKATNGQVIGTCELYESVAARDNGIESVMKNASDAEVVEE
jgi:uncharacterized protein YegP (UPF0339 family)